MANYVRQGLESQYLCSCATLSQERKSQKEHHDSYLKFLPVPNVDNTIKHKQHLLHQMNADQTHFLTELCSNCTNKHVYPWEKDIQYCYYNKWFMQYIKNETDKALIRYYDEQKSKNAKTEVLPIQKKMNVTDCDIGIHIRCGDMFADKAKKESGLMTARYYIESIHHLINISQKTEHCLQNTRSSNIFIISQIKQRWSHFGFETFMEKKFGNKQSAKNLADICDKYVYGLQNVLTTEFKDSHSVHLINNHIVNDFELMTKVPYFIAGFPSTLSWLAAMSRIDENNQYHMFAPNQYHFKNDNIGNPTVQRVKELSILPQNHIFSTWIFDFNQYGAYMISMHDLHAKYDFVLSNTSHQQILDDLGLFK
eukprot:755650_1